MNIRKLFFYHLSMAKHYYRMKGTAIEKLYLKSSVNDFNNRGGQGSLAIYSCNHYAINGGLCDRIQGIVSLYKVCKLNQFPFKVWFDTPFVLDNYLIPNKVDWTISPEAISINPADVKVYQVPIIYSKMGMSYSEEVEYQMKFFSSIFRKERNKRKQLHVYTNAHLAVHEEFQMLFNELFKPSPILQQAMEMNLNRIGGDYVSATFRFQNLLGDFKEANVQELSEIEKQDYIERSLRQLEIIHQQYPNLKLLVTADSMTFLKVANDRLDYVYTIPGNLVHMSYTTDASFDTYLKSFVDLIMVSKAQKIHLLKMGKMYHSGFAQTASFINNRPYEVIEY